MPEIKEIKLGNLNGHTGGSYAYQVYDSNGLSPTLTDMQGGGRQPHTVEVKKMKIKIRQATKQGFIECEIPGLCDLKYPSSENRRGRVLRGGQISPTITTEDIPSLIEFGNEKFYNFLYEIDGEIYLIRIRKLTPMECWRLMNFSDEDFRKAESVCSNTNLYKQAGNSIVRNCLVAIFGQMFEGKEEVYKSV